MSGCGDATPCGAEEMERTAQQVRGSHPITTSIELDLKGEPSSANNRDGGGPYTPPLFMLSE